MTPAPQPQEEYIREEVMYFAKAMEDTLRKHDNKGGWLYLGYGDLLRRVRKELDEAIEADEDPQNYSEVANELVDVANYCMMYWDINHPRVRSRPAPSPQWTDDEVMKEIEDAFDRGLAAAEETIDMKKHDSAIRNQTLDEMFPRNTKINSNGELDGGWELDPKALFKLQREIEKNPQFEEEPDAEQIEVVVLAIMKSLRTKEQP